MIRVDWEAKNSPIPVPTLDGREKKKILMRLKPLACGGCSTRPPPCLLLPAGVGAFSSHLLAHSRQWGFLSPATTVSDALSPPPLSACHHDICLHVGLRLPACSCSGLYPPESGWLQRLPLAWGKEAAAILGPHPGLLSRAPESLRLSLYF